MLHPGTTKSCDYPGTVSKTGLMTLGTQGPDLIGTAP
jgi:hypothetical protein